jgi:hypothetical protein
MGLIGVVFAGYKAPLSCDLSEGYHERGNNAILFHGRTVGRTVGKTAELRKRVGKSAIISLMPRLVVFFMEGILLWESFLS